MIRGVSYSNGKTKVINFDRYKLNSTLTWIYLSEASLKELNLLSDKTNIPLFELKHSLDPREKPRTASKNNYSLIIFRAFLPTDINNKTTFPIEFIITKNLLITISPEKSTTLDKIFTDIDATLWKTIQNDGFSNLIFKILLYLIRDYERYLEEVDDNLDDLEETAFQARDKDLNKLIRLKRRLVFLRRSLIANKDMLNEIEEDTPKYIKTNEFYKEVYIEYSQIASTEELIKDRITGILEIFLSAASNNLNMVMKSFTVIASVLLIPMVISGAYGMNLILPLATHPSGFIIVIIIMIVSMILMLLFFKLKKWL